jgi:hypothetical protein
MAVVTLASHHPRTMVCFSSTTAPFGFFPLPLRAEGEAEGSGIFGAV